MEKTQLSEEQKSRILGFMNDVALFQSLSQDGREKVLNVAEVFRFEAGESLVSEGDDANAFYLVTEGRVTVFTQRGDERTRLTDMGPTSTFGEIGILLDTPRTASIVARDSVIACRFKKEIFAGLFQQVPAFGKAVAVGMARRLVSASAYIDLPQHDETDHDDPALRLLPIPFVQRHRLLPLRMQTDTLTIGFVDDPDASVMNAIHNYIPGVKVNSVRIGKDYFNTLLRNKLGLGDEPAKKKKTAKAVSTVGCELDPLFERGVAEGISDIHLSAGKKPSWRIDGDILILDDAREVGRESLFDIFKPFMEARHLRDFEEHGDADFSYNLSNYARFRVNLYRDMGGVNASLRLIPSHIMSLDGLGLPEAVTQMCTLPSGLIMVTGPTGSGKSTTMAAMVHQINQHRRDHIITLEDPVEFLHENQNSIIHQREVGGHASDFGRALRSCLREDPDVILVGETRDLETLRMVVEVANTGHLVFATMHTNSAISTVNRMVDMFPAEAHTQVRNTLSSVLRGVICQTLCKRIGGGRSAAFEVMVVTRAIAGLIREGKTAQIISALQAGKKDGHQLLNDALAKMVRENLVDPEEALKKTNDRASLESLLKRLRPTGA